MPKLGVKVKVTGVQATLNQLAAIKRSFARAALKKSILAGGRILRDEAKGQVPEETGLLKKSLALKQSQYQQGGVSVATIGARGDIVARRNGKPPLKTKRKGFRRQVTRRSGAVMISDPTKYLHLVEGGRAAVVAGMSKGKPTGKKLLSDGAKIYGARVGPVKPNAFLIRARNQGMPKAQARMLQILKDELQKAKP